MMREGDITYRCPDCGHEETQRPGCDIWHPCPKRRAGRHVKKLVKLKPVRQDA